MESPRFDPVPGCADGWVIAIRKAATLARWVPGVGVAVNHPLRPGGRVASWGAPRHCRRVTVAPVVFHRLVRRLVDGARRPMAEALGLETSAPIDVVLFGRREVEIEAQGLVRVEVDGRWGMYVFAAALDEPGRAAAACDASATPLAVRVQAERDRELGITLVHAVFPLCDPEREQAVREVVAARAASCAADEVARAVAALEGLR